MTTGINATITNLTNGTTANAPDVLASLNSLNSNGVSNDGGKISTDGNGNITATAGQLRNVSILPTPYHLTTNPTINSGTTTNLTCTGGSTGVPSGAIAVLLGIGIFANTANGYIWVYPTGATAGQYFGLTGVGTSYTVGFAIAPLSSGGQITVKANASNIVLQDWYIFGYIM